MANNLEEIKEVIKIYKDNKELLDTGDINLSELLDFAILGVTLNDQNNYDNNYNEEQEDGDE